MLVLTRKVQQEIVIGSDITITVLEVSGQSVRLGIDAPRNIRVLRRELQQRMEMAVPESTPTAEMVSNKQSLGLVRQPHVEMNPATVPALRAKRMTLVDRRSDMLRGTKSNPRVATV